MSSGRVYDLGKHAAGGVAAAALARPPSRRCLWHRDLIAPPSVAPILRELCGSFEWGHLHPDCLADRHGCFRLDHDNAHFIAPFNPAHTPDDGQDFPATDQLGEVASHPSTSAWSPGGILEDGLHGVSVDPEMNRLSGGKRFASDGSYDRSHEAYVKQQRTSTDLVWGSAATRYCLYKTNDALIFGNNKVPFTNASLLNEH